MIAEAFADPVNARRMWAGGPLRRWSATRDSGSTMPLAVGGFWGPYICDRCQLPCAGVRCIKEGCQGARKWLCGDCLNGGQSR